MGWRFGAGERDNALDLSKAYQRSGVGVSRNAYNRPRSHRNLILCIAILRRIFKGSHQHCSKQEQWEFTAGITSSIHDRELYVHQLD